MKLLERLIEQVPEGLKVEQAVIGVYLAGVVASNGQMGLATVYPPSHHRGSLDELIEPELKGKALKDLAQYALSSHPLSSALGVSALNAGIGIPEQGLVEGNLRDLIKGKARDLNLAVVGHFPFVNEVAPLARQCWVVEKEPREGDLPESATERVLKDAEVVVITASALVNHSLEKLLEWAKGRYIFLVGPSAPFSQVLFEEGVNVIAGAVVENVKDTLSRIMLAYPFWALPGVKKVIWKRI